MKQLRIVNRTRDSVLGSQVGLADDMWSRGRGYLGRRSPEHGEGLLLSPCRAVHTFGMSYPLDVIFLNRRGEVLALYPELRPRRFTTWYARARYVLEVPPGTIKATGTSVGDRVAWMPADVPEVEPFLSNGRHAEASTAGAPAEKETLHS